MAQWYIAQVHDTQEKPRRMLLRENDKLLSKHGGIVSDHHYDLDGTNNGCLYKFPFEFESICFELTPISEEDVEHYLALYVLAGT